MAKMMDSLRHRTVEWEEAKPAYISSNLENIEKLQLSVAIVLHNLEAGTSSERLLIQFNAKYGDGETMLMKACRLNLHDMVRDLLKFPQLDIQYKNPRNGDHAIYICIFYNSVECFIELIKSGRVDWNKEDEESKKTPGLLAAQFHRVEFLQELLKVDGIRWNRKGRAYKGIDHLAVISMKKSCHDVLKIILQIPDFDVNLRDDKGFTSLEYALTKRDFKSIMILFSLPQLDLKRHDWNLIQELADIGTLIRECHKANKETGVNFSDVVNFLTELKQTLSKKRASSGRNKKKKSCIICSFNAKCKTL